jgi:uncharacterized protein YcbX
VAQVGTVEELWRYPVKSFQGEPVDALDRAPGGAKGDRTLAVVDPAARKVLSAKRYAALLMASARIDGERVVLTMPDGGEHASDDRDVHRVLSDWLDLEVRLMAPPEEGIFPMEMYTGMSDEDTPLFDWPGPEGTWLDLADVHWLTTSSISTVAANHRDGEWDVRRFRPTALIATENAGFVEEGWASIRAGGVGTEVMMPTPRCTMPSRAQPGLMRDKAIGTTIRDTNANNLGVYASVTRSGTVRVGDPVHAD